MCCYNVVSSIENLVNDSVLMGMALECMKSHIFVTKILYFELESINVK